MNLQNRLISGIKFNTISTIVITILQTGQLLVLARLLSPNDFGLMAMMEIVIGIAYIFTDFGVSGAIIFKKDINENELSSLYWLNLFTGIFVFLIIFLLRSIISGFFNEPRLIALLGLISTVFVIAPLGAQYQVLFQKQLLFNITYKIEIVSALTSAIVTITSAILGLGIYSLIIGELARTFTKALLSFLIGRKDWIPRVHFNFHEIIFYFKFGLFQMGEKVSNYFNQRIDQIIIGALLGANALGYYTVAYNIAIAPFLRINPIITRVAFPALSIIQDDINKIKDTYFSIIRSLSHINIPILTMMIIMARPIVQLFLGNKWLESVPLLQLLCVVAIIRSIINPVGSLLLSKGRADLGFYWNLIATIIQTPLLYFSILFFGVRGSAISLITIYSIQLFLGYFILIKPLIGPCSKEYISSLIPPMAFTFASSIIIFLGTIVFKQTNLIDFFVPIFIGGIFYLITMYFFYGKEKVINLIKLFDGKNV